MGDRTGVAAGGELPADHDKLEVLGDGVRSEGDGRRDEDRGAPSGGPMGWGGGGVSSHSAVVTFIRK